jgi:hypothetical protein
VAPLGAPNTRIFTRAALLDAVRAMDFSVHVARELLIPPLHPSAAIRTDTGLVWREPASSAGDPNDRVLAIGLDGSVALRGFLWEAGRRNAPLAWGSDGLDIGTCVDEIVGVIAIADRLITHHERRPIRVRLRLKGIKGRHVAYSKAEDKFYPGGLRRSALESFETELKNLPVSASRAQITNLIDAVVRELNYLFDHIDQTYVRRRALERLKLALPQMAHRYPDGREIAREYVVVNDSRTLLTAHGTSSAESDVLVAVKFARDGEPFADLGLLDPDTQPPYWANLPDGVPPELAKRVAGLIAGDLAAQ